MPCRVRQLSKYELEITLQEGRNRQIRRMLDALGYSVLELHRLEVMGITLSGLREGQCRDLTRHEMTLVNQALAAAASSEATGVDLATEEEEEE